MEQDVSSLFARTIKLKPGLRTLSALSPDACLNSRWDSSLPSCNCGPPRFLVRLMANGMTANMIKAGHYEVMVLCRNHSSEGGKCR